MIAGTPSQVPDTTMDVDDDIPDISEGTNNIITNQLYNIIHKWCTFLHEINNQNPVLTLSNANSLVTRVLYIL